MKLEIHERLALLELLPLESDYAGWKEIRVAKEVLELTPEEKEFIEYRLVTLSNGAQQIHWNEIKSMDAVRDIPLSEYIISTLREILANLSKKKKLTEKTLSVYEKIVVMYL